MLDHAASSNRYLQVGLTVIAVSGISAVYLNVEGVKCISQLNTLADSPISPTDTESKSEACFIITNSYVYSLFGVVAGALILGLWARMRRQRKGMSWEKR